MPKQAPYVPFYPSDWLAGTRGMTAAETGVYITLIATMYERGEPLKDDRARLGRLCGAPGGTFQRALDTLMAAGKIIIAEGGGLWNERVAKELLIVAKSRNTKREAANVRWQKNGNDINAPLVQEHTPNHANAILRARGLPEPEPEPERTNEQGDSQSVADKASSFDRFWLEYPNKVGKPRARRTFLALAEPVEIEAILAGVRRYAATKPADRHWLNPATFLIERRWEDGMEAVTRAAQQVFVEEGTEAWRSWQAVKKTAVVTRDGSLQRGWWFPSERPPNGRASP